MSEPIQGSSSQPLINPALDGAEADVASPPPRSVAPPRPATANAVEPFTCDASDAAVVNGDSNVERFFRNQLEALKPGESCEFTGDAALAMSGLKLGFNGKITATRQEDGSFLVEVGVDMNAGVGGKDSGLKAGVGAGTVFHVSTAGQAADLSDALMKGAVVVGADAAHPIAGLAMKGMASANVDELGTALRRLESYRSNVEEVKFSAEFKGEVGKKKGPEFEALGLDILNAKASGSVTGKESFALNLEKGEVTFTQSVAVGGEAACKIPVALNVKGNAKGTLSYTQTYKPTAENLERFRRGELTAAQLVMTLKTPASVTTRVELEVGGKASFGPHGETKAKVSCEVTEAFNAARMSQTLDGAFDVAMSAKWRVEGEFAVGTGIVADIGVASVEATAVKKQKAKAGGEHSFSEAAQRAINLVADANTVTNLRAARAF